MTIDRETIIDRVKKLLALAGNNTNVNEAAAAMARAQRLMLEHKLASAEIDTSDSPGDDEVGEIAVDEVGEFLLAWKPVLMHALAKASCCSAVRYGVIGPAGRKAVRFKIVGTESDTTYVAYVYRYLCTEIDRLCDVEAKGKGFGYRNSFRRGAVNAISTRLKSERAQVVREQADSGKALMVLGKAEAAVEAYVKQKLGPVRTARASTATNSFGYGSGQRAGSKIAIPGQDSRASLGKSPAQIKAQPRKVRSS